MEKKTGVYICTGCGIGESLDAEKLSGLATKEYKVPVCKTHATLCSEEGVDLIKKDMEAEGVNTVVIAACSSRVKYEVFDFDVPCIIERVNIREQVVWSHPANDEDTQMMAEDYLRMTMIKTQKMEIPEPYMVEDLSKGILVVGGGLAGVTAATEAAKAGYQVALVEKNPSLGGWMTKMYKQAPTKPPYTDLEETDIAAKIKELEENSSIKVYTSAEIEKIAGGPGMFDVNIKQNGNVVTERTGAVVLATGTTPYDANKLGHLGFGKCVNVITTDMMEELAAKGKITRPSDGKEVQSVAFILCAGSRDENHLPYCSSVCCVESLKQATYLKELNPESTAYIFYKDMRAPGQYEHFYKRVQKDKAVFIKGEVTGVSEDGSKNVIVEAEDVLTGEKMVTDPLDMVVLATGMVPTTGVGEEVLPPGVEPGSEFIPYTIIKSGILKLDYRQGLEIPVLKYGFPDSNFICFPYETRRTGIYAAGTVRTPMDIPSTVQDATGAALKAIQCVESTAIGATVHPRVGDLSYPDFFMQKCTQCKRCTEECPFGAINEDEKANPIPIISRCRRCGTCMGACPERIISFKNYSVDIIGSMIKEIEVPEEDEEKPRIVVLACENDACATLDMAGINRMNYNAWVRVIPLRCLGSMNLVWIADALSKGIDGILLLGCKYGDDYQCHFAVGSRLSDIRLSKVSETLDRLALESDRVRMVQLGIMDYDQIPAILDKFAARLEELGPNPYKGF